MKKIFDAYRNSTYMPSIILVVWYVVFKLVFWVSRTEEVWAALGVKEGDTTFLSSVIESLYFVEYVLIFFMYLILFSIFYTGFYQFKNKKSAWKINVSLVAFIILTVILDEFFGILIFF